MKLKRCFVLSCFAVMIILFFSMGNNMPIRTWYQADLISNIPGGGYSKDLEDEYEGIAFETPIFSVGEGKYSIEVDYKSDTENNYLQLYSKRDNRYYPLRQQNLPINKGQAQRIAFETEEPLYSIQIQVISPQDEEIYLRKIDLKQVKGIWNEEIILIILIALLVFLGIRIIPWKTLSSSEQVTAVYLVIVALAVSYPLFSNAIFRGADFSFHASRIEGIAYGLRSGQFPVRIHEKVFADYGHVAPILYPELFLYIPATLLLVGVSLATSIQVFLLLINLVTAINMYVACKSIFKTSYAGLIGMTLYTTAPYRLINMYHRFALGEVLAMAFLPLVIYGIYEICEGDRKKWIWLVVGFSGVLQSHIITALFTVIICLAMIALYWKNLNAERIRTGILCGCVIVLLNVWFIIPLLEYMMFNGLNTERLQKSNASLYTLQFSQLFQLGTLGGLEYGGVSVGKPLSSALPLQLGAPILVAICMGVENWIRADIRCKDKFTGCAAILGSACLWATTYWFPWDIITGIPLVGKIMSYIQFPYRLLSYSSVFLSFVGVYLLINSDSKRREKQAIILFICCLLTVGNLLSDFMMNKWVLYKGERSNGYAVSQGEYLIKGTDIGQIFLRGEEIYSPSENIKITDFVKDGTSIDFRYINRGAEDGEAWVELPLMYYPNYIAEMGGEILNTSIGNNNVLRVEVPEFPTGRISVNFKIPIMWRIGELMSLCTLLIYIFRKKITRLIKNN